MACQPRSFSLVDSIMARLQPLVCRARCLVCGADGSSPERDLCAGCARELVPLGVSCRRCAQPLGGTTTELLCGRCLKRSPAFASAFCAFHYCAPLDALVRGLKYREGLAAGRLLAQLFCAEYRRSGRTLPACILPVPLSSARFRQRGFNQSIELARLISRELGCAHATDVLVRTRDTAEQAGLKLRARRRNVRGAFALVRPLDCQHVVVLDDVMTSGSTLNEIARVLMRAGVPRVEVWAIARAGAT